MATSEEVARLAGVSRATVSRALNRSARMSARHYTTPPLTTARQDRIAMGRGAVQRLVAMAEGAEETSPLIVPTQLVVRQSTGPVPKEVH